MAIKVYNEIQTIKKYILPKKQAVKRHYGSHQYFTKRAWNVVQGYIECYSNPGDVVCDPYGGTGVTVVEALVMGRKGNRSHGGIASKHDFGYRCSWHGRTCTATS